MAWEAFQWGSRGVWYKTPDPEVYVAHTFIADGIRVVLFGQGEEGQQYLHVFGVQVPDGGPPTFTDCVAVNTAINAWVFSDYRPMWASGIRARKVVSTGMNAVPAAQATFNINQAGTRAGESLTSQTTAFVAATTHLSGRRNHGGQSAWPPVKFDMDVQDRFTAGYVTAIQGIFNSLLARMTAAGYALAVASLTDAAMKPIALYTCNDDVVDSRRRRTINRGR